MTEESGEIGKRDTKSSGFRWYHLVIGLLLSILIALVLAFWWFRSNFYASKVTPVQLSQQEEIVLNKKLESLDSLSEAGRVSDSGSAEPGKIEVISEGGPFNEKELDPEPYSEQGASREIFLTERELNALIANKPEISENVIIDLSEDLVSLKLIVPVDEDILFLGGKTLKLKAGLKLAYLNNQPIVAIQGLTLGGVPIPNAWMGGLKYQNLIEEFGEKDGFLGMFSKGVEDIEVVEGAIRVKLKE